MIHGQAGTRRLEQRRRAGDQRSREARPLRQRIARRIVQGAARIALLGRGVEISPDRRQVGFDVEIHVRTLARKSDQPFAIHQHRRDRECQGDAQRRLLREPLLNGRSLDISDHRRRQPRRADRHRERVRIALIGIHQRRDRPGALCIVQLLLEGAIAAKDKRDPPLQAAQRQRQTA